MQATDNQNREVGVVSNPDTFRFCFVEKYWIDAFPRIPHGRAQRTELIATLFGLDKFNKFVGHFNGSIDQQLVLTATKQLASTGTRRALATDQARVNGEAKALKGNSKTAHSTSQTRLDGQAEHAGPHGPEASGTKAEWPRFDTKRGEQPASPTAVRRDAQSGYQLPGSTCTACQASDRD